MRKHRFFLPIDLHQDQTLDLDQDSSHQIIRVLRLQIGQPIFLFNNSDCEFTAIIKNITHKIVTVSITRKATESLESPCKINLGQVLNKGEKMDLVVQKATELGVHSITPLHSTHAVMKLTAERSNGKIAHWQKVANSSSCQSGRNIVPVVHPPQDLNTWITKNNDAVKLIISPSDTATKLRDLKINSPLSILIGPEGGFSEAEINCAIKNNFLQVSLGPRILRTETAGLAVIAILQAMFGDL